jgi:hypothetical protein
VWFSFGFVGDNKIVLAMDKEEVVCKTKTDERIKLEKETNNLIVLPIYRYLKKDVVTFLKPNTSSEKKQESEFVEVKFTDANCNHSLLRCPCCVVNAENLVYRIQHFGMHYEERIKFYVFRAKLYKNIGKQMITGSQNYKTTDINMQQKNFINLTTMQRRTVDPIVGEKFDDIQKFDHDDLTIYFNKRTGFWYLVAYVDDVKNVLTIENNENDCVTNGKSFVEYLKEKGLKVEICTDLIQEYTDMLKTIEEDRKQEIFIEFTDQLQTEVSNSIPKLQSEDLNANLIQSATETEDDHTSKDYMVNETNSPNKN